MNGNVELVSCIVGTELVNAYDLGHDCGSGRLEGATNGRGIIGGCVRFGFKYASGASHATYIRLAYEYNGRGPGWGFELGASRKKKLIGEVYSMVLVIYA